MRTLICLLSLLCAVPAAASPVVWTVEGEVTGVNGDSALASLLSPLQTFSVELVADAAAVDLCDNPVSGLYETPGATVHVGSLSWTASATFWEVNNQMGNCVPGGGIVTRSFFDNAPFSLFVMGWGNTAIEDFPTSIEAGFAWFAELGPGPTVFADIEPAELSSVPEPATWLLVAVGLGLGRKRPRW